ncbi:MAG TPA: hypothetical protein VF957_23595 [Bradyrhizobium sp.]
MKLGDGADSSGGEAPGPREIIVPFAGATPSEDEDFHLCFFGGKVQCFFAPRSGA